MKTVLKILLCTVLALLLLVCALVVWLSAAEYKPAAVEDASVEGIPGSGALKAGQTLDIVTWNIGYCGLGAGSDFFMDGGKGVQSADEATVERYLSGISDYLYGGKQADLIMLQEVDVDSQRSYGINEAERLSAGNSVHALNYSCPFVPFPWPPIGRVNSGLFTTTGLQIDSAERISLPCPFSWPVSAANLKRCLLVSYLPIEGSDKQLVLVNLHLEAYDDGEGKIAQTKQLRDFIESEYEKGNYVIAGGDFNQVFPGTYDVYPNTHADIWTPGALDGSFLPEGWSYAYDSAVPTCRLLNQPYDPSDTADTQYYVIDGFILSPNVELGSLRSIDLGFESSDHNPVRINVTLK